MQHLSIIINCIDQILPQHEGASENCQCAPFGLRSISSFSGIVEQLVTENIDSKVNILILHKLNQTTLNIHCIGLSQEINNIQNFKIR